MAIRMHLFRLLRLLVLGWHSAALGSDGLTKQLPPIFRAEIGIREATGRNDGPRVAEYLHYCGLDEGYDWCAAFVSWVHGQAGLSEPRNAWAAALFPSKRTIWSKNGRVGSSSGLTPMPGDVFGIYVPSKKRIAHCGFIDQWDGKWCHTVEGNVDNAVVHKRRLVSTIHAVSRWHDLQN